MIPDLEEEKKALKDLYAGLEVSIAVENKIVHISPETAQMAIQALEYYISNMTL